ncbi:hypothetical protein ACFVUS_27285 [Nocardia sp. NPDC058058]|uniref:hypothetical protein n=1 Tax=Nocardia sp. NPDC058058 TaxID=3346317 RepID=UPI0036DB2FD2
MDTPLLVDQLCALRAEMYEVDRGTWLSARVTLPRGEQPQFSFNYDENPGWLPDLNPIAYVRDLEAFPRAPHYVPQWLREKLDRALQLERQHDADETDR